MNLTLGTLQELKVHLLNEALRTDTQWDSALAALGRGVAERLEKQCNRKFLRVVDDTFECSADRAHVSLPRYPVESVSKIEIRRSLTEGWVELTGVIQNQNLAAGLLYFGAELGSWSDRLRITYTGGFWFSPGSASILRGSESLAADVESFEVTFSPAFAAAPAVVCNVIAPDGGLIISAVPSEVTATGFVARLGFPIPGTGYSLAWFALAANQYTPDTTALKQDSLPLEAAAEELAVVFGTPFAGSPAVVCNVIAPEGGVIITSIPAEVSAAGFTARFAAPIPAAGYQLSYFALYADEETGLPSAMPGSATARPADLFLAWLLQCEHVWALRDKLGLSASVEKSGVSPDLMGLSRVQLIPDVQNTCWNYRRHSLL